MSLTSFIHIPEVRRRFTETFPKPRVDLDAKIVAPPLTTHYSLIGTAFDYLMRFYVKRLNPEAVESAWVAELAIDHLERYQEYFVAKKGYTTDYIENITARARNIIRKAKAVSSAYEQTGNITEELLVGTLHLAQLDPIFRAGIIDPNIGTADERDIKDLRNLISAIDPRNFKANQICVLNPTFGEGSRLVGGADCDLLIDNTLLDIKTVKALEIKRDYFNQLIGYYILFTIGGIDNISLDRIENVGIFFSRHLVLHMFPVDTFTRNRSFTEFAKWFRRKAEEVFGTP